MLLATLEEIADGGSNADMIQDLNDLSVVGKKNTGLLLKMNFDPSLLEKAAEMANDGAEILARSNGDRRENNAKRVIRDKAFIHLKTFVDEIQAAGKYVFRGSEERLKGYLNAYYKRKSKNKGIDKSEEEIVL